MKAGRRPVARGSGEVDIEDGKQGSGDGKSVRLERCLEEGTKRAS